jgi:hypothetical protein
MKFNAIRNLPIYSYKMIVNRGRGVHTKMIEMQFISQGSNFFSFLLALIRSYANHYPGHGYTKHAYAPEKCVSPANPNTMMSMIEITTTLREHHIKLLYRILY